MALERKGVRRLETTVHAQVNLMSCTLTFVTGNASKLNETKQMLIQKCPQIKLVAFDLDLVEIQGKSVADVARAKALEAAKVLNGPVMIEDFGFHIKALGGFPGPYIKWFVRELGAGGMWNIMEQLSDKRAETVSVFAYCKGPSCEPILFEGRCAGQIVKPRGSAKFGPDAVFQPDESTKTFAEMHEDEKQCISHRSKALNLMTSWFVGNVV
jgi:inosine triphosphate pyrophosphatase